MSQYDIFKLFVSVCLRLATPQIAVSGFQCSGVFDVTILIFFLMHYEPASVTDHPYPNSAPASSTSHTDPELPHSNEDKLTLSKSETDDSLIHCEQLKPSLFSRYSVYDVCPCPSAQQGTKSV
jgi:hypothetical protein